MAKITIYDEIAENNITFDTKTDCIICGEKHNMVNVDDSGETCEACFFDRRRMANPAW